MNRIEDIKRFMKENKITYAKLAEMSGVPKRTVDDIFSGHTKNPRIDTMQAIERALGIDNTPISKPGKYTPEQIAKMILTQAAAQPVETENGLKTVRYFLKFRFWERWQMPKAFRKLLKERGNVIFLNKYVDGVEVIYEGYFKLDISTGDKITVIGENLKELKRDFIKTVKERFTGGAK